MSFRTIVMGLTVVTIAACGSDQPGADGASSLAISAATIVIGETRILPEDDSQNADLLLAQPATLTQNATIQSLTFYVTSAAGKLRLGIYDASGPRGGPGSKKAETAEFVPVASSWNTAKVTVPVLLSPGTYWLAYLPSDDGLGFRKATGARRSKFYNFAYGPMPPTFATSLHTTQSHWSLYATLSVDGSSDTTPPSVPTGLTATAPSPSQVNLAWNASTDDVGVTGYLVDRCQGVGCSTFAQITDASGPGYTDAGVAASTNYSYRVRAHDAAGNVSGYSSVASVVTPAGGGGSTYTLPADRGTKWQPGVTYNGGIPSWPIASTVSCANTTSDLSTMQSAINAAHASAPNGVVVKINPGTCNLNAGTISVPSNTVLRGSGAGSTTLVVTNGATDNSYFPGTHNAPLIVVGDSVSSGSSVSLAADAAKGAYSISLSSVSGLSQGQYVLLDELSGAAWQTDPQGLGQIWASPDWRVVWQRHNPSLQTDDPYPDAWGWFCRFDRPQNEIKQIIGISGTTVTFSTPVHLAYRTSHSAQLTPYAGIVTNAGVESLSMRGGDQGNLRFEGAASSWAKNIESSHWLNEGVAVNNSFRVEVRDSYLHDASWPSPGGGGYALSIGWGSSEFLLENSISMMANKVMVARSAGAASVIGYNYFDDGYISGTADWIEVHANASHMVGPHHVLFEGNYAANWDSDKTHGNSTNHTMFRNLFRGLRRAFKDIGGGTHDDATQGGGPMRAAGPAAYGYWMSFVGNVLGASGQMGGWVYEDTANGIMTSGTNAIFALGWDDWVSAYPSVKPDPNVSSGPRAVLRDGNWDWVRSRQSWDTAAAPLPNSFYMSGKPAFFGSNPWPWVDPSTGAMSTLPAKARFDANAPNG